LVDSYGKQRDKDQFTAVSSECDKAISLKDAKKLEHCIKEFLRIRWAVLFEQPGYWIGTFQEIKTANVTFSDPEKAKGLINEGNIALQRQDIESLKSLMFQLWDLIPSNEQEDIKNKVSEAGIRRQ